jgi:hypothetical protein
MNVENVGNVQNVGNECADLIIAHIPFNTFITLTTFHYII